MDSLDFNSPTTSGTVGAVTSSAAVAAQTITFGAAIANGGTFWIRWTDFDLAPGADDGLAIDDLTLVGAVSGGSGTNPTATGAATSTPRAVPLRSAAPSRRHKSGLGELHRDVQSHCGGWQQHFPLNVSGTSISATTPSRPRHREYLLASLHRDR